MVLRLPLLAVILAACGPDTGHRVDADRDGYPDEVDCAPDDDTIHPLAEEACDDIDSNCDGSLVDYFDDLDDDGTPDCVDDDDDGDGESDDDDCAPTDPERNSGAKEVPDDGIDQDCSGFDSVTCFVDGDGDGYGTDATVLSEDDDCEDAGESDVDTDCNDGDDTVHPMAIETCDDTDTDCDGDFADGFDDLDGDGDPDCTDPDVDGDGDPNTTDCLPTDAAYHNGAPELCDGFDFDCDEDLVDGYADFDDDGDPDCHDDDDDDDLDLDVDDCDDHDPTVFTGAPEACDDIDSDCDGSLVDAFDDLDDDTVPDCIDTDADGDGYDAGPDCDDLNDEVFPGADETCDGVDNDCNELADDDPACIYGTGSDGDFVVGVLFNLSLDDGPDADDTPDGFFTRVSANPVGTSLLVEDASGFQAGDRVMLIHQQGYSSDVIGNNSDTEDVGNYERLEVTSTQVGVVHVKTAPALSYDGEAGFDDQQVMLLRVPQYASVTIAPGHTLTASGWSRTSKDDGDGNPYALVDAGAGGVVAFTTQTLVNDGTISANGLGYYAHDPEADYAETIDGLWFLRDNTTPTNACNGAGGTPLSHLGAGGNGWCCSSQNYFGGGGGGGYGTAGSTGANPSSCVGPPGPGGSPYGTPDLARLYHGSAGNSGHGNWYYNDDTHAGGVVYVAASVISGTGVISSDATQVSHGSQGGSSGGSVHVIADTVDGQTFTALGGPAGSTGVTYEGGGGAGGKGRIRVDCNLVNGVACQETGTTPSAELLVAGDPSPGYSAPPGP